MADASNSHSTAPAQNLDVNNNPEIADLSHAQEPAPAFQPTTPTDLPLRQSKHSVGGTRPKIYDVTEKFTRACNALEVGQLVKDDYFTLFESIGAIEIMDPKMDSGFLQPGETLEDDYDTLTPLLPEELIGIMDQLLCYEMAWHTGYPLSQTLFTSVYIDKLLWPEVKVLEQAQFCRGEIPKERKPGPLLDVLRAYCLGLIKGCDLVIAKVTGRDYYEEEDFCTHTYNRVLFVSTPVDAFLRELDAAVDILEDPDLDINDTLRKAILSRLELRTDLLQAFDMDLTVEGMPYSWPPVLEIIDTLKTTHQLGQTVPGAFSPKMQRRLASTVPPRPIVELDFKDALEKLQNMASACHEATRLISIKLDPLEYQSFLWHFSSRSPPNLTYSRSYLSTILHHPEMYNPAMSLSLGDVKTLVLPASPILDPGNWTLSPPRNPLLPKPPRLQLALLMDDFVERADQAYLDLWVALVQNRCRVRRMLRHVIGHWDILQAETSVTDSEISAAANEMGISDAVMEFSLSTWVYHKKLWMIEKMILLGFEQEIYLPDEYAGMYLFLSLIVTRRKELLCRVQVHYTTYKFNLLRQGKMQEKQQIDDTEPYVASLIAEAEATASFSLALARFYIVLLYLHLLPIPSRPFSTEKLRYEVRMKPFLGLQPPEVPDFDDFKAHTQLYGDVASPSPDFAEHVAHSDSALWSEIDGQLRTAKAAFAEYKRIGVQAAKAEGVESSWDRDVQNAVASCVALGLVVTEIRDWVTEKGVNVSGIKAEIPEAGTGKRYADGWIVPKVVKE
ncbi:hypothetical protein COCC4DRAFT_71022 [Bipolaris maydis ATCC 48331]|uniref:Amino-acid N-acetyltransferase subunit Mak10 n=2 Tax=Cochliobolus heterostrophus TaxID=5016 RepID=M2UI40_COCH5|nr:uncharacterized protein COCC4DRAFT_71022 [Bipolaris maydis ATCC 48331]EMD87612.1 hypothetical protein COCHEDRAFT_1145443 [Bipolaris maydis C5]KAJ5023122.1 Mak10 subunit, NatC N-terminal acetyltransferase-domain-containing protein [Bipolaris maydis]ENI06811.1 hypothetical protein COCC4DRAFT_71022 [Bipolaris maydis ATCC 48331]KAJ5056128.1 Mak10 subunit, NatC N-terminal acetyltransferase-domain-containing protein [Bipolaris maydis]KAJ6193876.1 Mak10 subunit, NatC N-terminal acetyltransferase-d